MADQDPGGTVSALSDGAAATKLEALGYPHYRVRSILVEARQTRSVTLERHLITLLGDGFRIETLGSRQEDAVAAAEARERHHYEGDDCDPPHVILPPELSAEHAELLAGSTPAASSGQDEPGFMTQDQARQFITDLGYDGQEAEAAVHGAMAVDGGVYRTLSSHDVAYVIEPGPGGKHLGYVITAKEQGEPVIPPEQDQAWREMVELGQEIQGVIDAETEQRAEYAAAVEELARTFQNYIGGDSPREERTEQFTIDGAAFYTVTPAQWRELMALAPDDIVALNDKDANVPPWPPQPEIVPPVPFGTPSQQDQAPPPPSWAGAPREWPAGMHEAHCGPKAERDDRCSLGCDCPCHRGEPVPPLASGLTGDEAVEKLVILGYDEERANHYVADALAHGMSWLPRDHTVWYTDAGTDPAGHPGSFAVYTKVPHPDRPGVHISGPAQPGTRLASYAGSYGTAPGGGILTDHNLGISVRVPGPPLDLAPPGRGHGYYQDGGVPAILAALEVADGHQLSREQIRKHGTDRYPSPAAQYAKLLDEAGELGEALMNWCSSEDPRDFARVRGEYADAGLALFALGNKLGLDLIQCMRELVAADTRDFRTEPGAEG